MKGLDWISSGSAPDFSDRGAPSPDGLVPGHSPYAGRMGGAGRGRSYTGMGFSRQEYWSG